MNRNLTADRVHSDIDVLARAGLDLPTFLAEVDESLRRAVPYVGACYALMDPATRLLTKTFKFGDLVGRDDHDLEWADIEYGDVEATCFTELAAGSVRSVGVHDVTAGDVATSRRMRDYMIPYFGYTDELRAVARSGDDVWGGLALFRADDEPPFDPSDVDFVGSLSSAIAAGLRAGVLARYGTEMAIDHCPGPAVVVVDAGNEISHMSPGAETQLEGLITAGGAAGAAGVVGALVARARSWSAGLAPAPPRIRVRSDSGGWFVLHAAPLAGRRGGSGDVVVTIEVARPPDIVPLVVAAFDLTTREREVTQLVLQGADTKQIAARLHLSAYTVQDHLKAIFDKAEVRSRRELMARIFLDSYAPYLGDEITPSGWFRSAPAPTPTV